MATRKRPTKKSGQRRKAAPVAEKADRVTRHRVITFRLSQEEADLIATAADREPVARFSRRAVLARAQQAVKAKK